jgi:hypothetical protein
LNCDFKNETKRETFSDKKSQLEFELLLNYQTAPKSEKSAEKRIETSSEVARNAFFQKKNIKYPQIQKNVLHKLYEN